MKFLVFAVASSLLVAYAIGGHPVRVRGIYITQPEEGYQSTLGVVHGLRHCGGHGKVLQLRVDGCSGDGVCQFPADGQRRLTEYDFVPSADVDSLGIRVVIIEDGSVVDVYEQAIADSEVLGGSRYIVHAAASAAKELKGKSITVQYLLYHVDDNEVETCAEADFNLV